MVGPKVAFHREGPPADPPKNKNNNNKKPLQVIFKIKQEISRKKNKPKFSHGPSSYFSPRTIKMIVISIDLRAVTIDDISKTAQ